MFLLNKHYLKPITVWVTYALLCSGQVYALEPNQVEITADDAQGVGQSEIEATGNVTVKRNEDTLKSDWLKYRQEDNHALAGDQFTLERGTNTTICGSTLSYYLDKQTGEGDDASFESEQNGQRVQGKSNKVLMQGENKYQLQNAALNTCQPGDSSWYLKADKIDIDYGRNVGVARNARIVFEGVPILYTPWIDFPLDNGRKSGLLAPTFKFGSDGFELETPYYFNLAPNYDATVYPRYINSRGFMLGGQFRYLMPSYSGKLEGQFLPHDKKTKEDRHLLSLQHAQIFDQLPIPVRMNIDFNQVSDDNYFRDFGDRVSVASNVNLNREIWFGSGKNIGTGYISASIRAQGYQTLQNDEGTLIKPYARLPEIKVNYTQPIMKASFSLNTEFTRFHSSRMQSGNRFVAYPTVAWDFTESWGYFRPKVGVHYTQYSLDEFQGQNSRSKTRSLPIISIDTGLSFERPSMFAGQQHTQTLEPRLFYTYITSKSQNDLPNFDSSENDFNFTQLFRENRFSGQDRINGANQITAALTSRYINNENGLERLRVMIGQRFYFKKEDMSLSGEIRDRDKVGSDFLAQVGGDLNRNWRLDTDYHYNQALKTTERFSSSLRYNPEAGKTVSLRYLFDREEETYPGQYGRVSQLDLAAQWPIGKKFYVLGRQNYSFADKESLEQLLGVEYNDGCWSLRVVGQRYVTDKDRTKNAIFVQLELGNLGGIGNNPFDALRLAIPGYSKINEVRK
ncbi:LPS-assembly protein LptD [Neisseria sp. Ec49-e6-T10]|uniref:LPS-assembly protein LptD n=1 Tax=Neisseria sp. Ec49-e6-T10 TaxID=3140744 RepID=UPI003EBA7FB1